MLSQGQVSQTTVLFLLICAASLTTGTHGGSVSFLESKPGSYLRLAPSNSIQGSTFSYSDVSDAIAVLLGTVPSSINDESASKLNDLLVPNPFNRPQAVLLLNIEESKAGGLSVASSQDRVLQPGSSSAELHVPDHVTFVSLSSKLDEELASDDKTFEDLASFFGGSYESGGEPSKGLLSFYVNGNLLKFNLAKKLHQIFTLELFSVVQNAKDAALALDEVPGGFIVGTLPAVEHLCQGSESIMTSQQASELQAHIARTLFTYLDTAFNGGLLGVVVDSSEPVLNMKFTQGPSRLQLLQTSSDYTSAIAEVLTETIIAYITGILFVVALIIGTCFLFKMPVTRDTLLYSGAKLD